MNIKKPEFKFNLENVENPKKLLDEAREQETDICRKSMKDTVFSGESFRGMGFLETEFENCRFLECDFEKTSFINVRFQNCDLSNCRFGDGYFKQCELISCKGTGANFTMGTFLHLTISDTTFSYANFNGSKISAAEILDTDMSHANLSECKLEKTKLSKVKFIGTGFFKTSLRGVDFTESDLEAPEISDTCAELRGATITIFQAAEIARLMGINIK